MKKFSLIFAILMTLLVAPAHATISLGIYFGNVYNEGGASLVGSGTLWALVVDDASDDGVFAGFNTNQRLTSSAQADTYFDISQRVDVGNTLNGNTVAAMGGFNTGDYGAGNMYLSIILSDAYANQNFAFYWFPGATYTGAGSHSISSYDGAGAGLGDQIGSQVGGVNITTARDGLLGMTLGNAGATMDTAGIRTTALGGTTAQDYLYAVAIPEPTSSLLALFGGLALLFRRRRHA